LFSAGTFSRASFAVHSFRRYRSRRVDDELCDHIGMGEKRDMRALDFVRFRLGARRVETFDVGIDRLILLGNEKP
jgi:hypothetical protein